MKTNLEEKHPYFNRRRRSIIRDFFRLTSIHGLPAITRSYNSKNLFCWSLIFILFFAVMLYFVTTSILVYFTYPTQTNVDTNIEYPILFPAVTVCNYASIRYDLFIGPFTNYMNSLGLISSNASAATILSIPNIMYFVDQFLIGVVNRNESVADYVFNLNELLFSCTYNGLVCNASDFIQFSSALYGLCYTFNAKTSNTDGDTTVRTSGDNGGQGILELEFFIYDYLNIPYTNDGVGMIALLHDNIQVPQVDIDGIGLAPNRKHTLQFFKKKTSFLSAPYTNCTTTIRADMKTMFETYYIGTQYQYSRQSCVNLCIQAYVYFTCNCTTPVYWNARSVLLPNGEVILAPLCGVFNPCYPAATKKFMNDLTIIDQQCSHCTSECQLTSFDMQPSAILAPALYKQLAIKQWLENNLLTNSSRVINLPDDWSGNSSTYINRNYVGLQVILGTFLVNSYTQSAVLSWVDVISNVGGQTGLWIGVSMLSVVELFEMFYRLFRLRLSKIQKKSPTDLEETDFEE